MLLHLVSFWCQLFQRTLFLPNTLHQSQQKQHSVVGSYSCSTAGRGGCLNATRDSWTITKFWSSYSMNSCSCLQALWSEGRFLDDPKCFQARGGSSAGIVPPNLPGSSFNLLWAICLVLVPEHPAIFTPCRERWQTRTCELPVPPSSTWT